MPLPDDLARFPCRLDLAAVKWYTSNKASYLLNEIDMPVFRTNTLILECPQQTAMVGGAHKLQGLIRTSRQEASGMDEPWHKKLEIYVEHRLYFD